MNDDDLPKRLSRRDDPDTSKKAAAEITATTLGEKKRQALRLIEQHPGKTSKELESFSGHGDGEVRKRLNDLRIVDRAHKGPKRKCEVTGRSAYTWLPGPNPEKPTPIAVAVSPVGPPATLFDNTPTARRE